jgi:DNA-directed RNA polymerase specialized sigma24 family protein
VPDPGGGTPVPRGAAGLTGQLDHGDVARVFREEHGRAVAILVRVFGDIDIAEDAVQEAFTIACERWPKAGVPPSPAGWIITTARNREIDRLRRESSRAQRHEQAHRLAKQRRMGGEPEGPVRDDRLRLIFTCCHPALGQAKRRSQRRCGRPGCPCNARVAGRRGPPRGQGERPEFWPPGPGPATRLGSSSSSSQAEIAPALR